MTDKEIRVVGIITARGGSRSVPGKNIRPLGGKPLITYTIEAAKRSGLLTRCIVSTDDEEIAAIARQTGADAPFLRPAALATERSTSLEAVNHALDWLTNEAGERYDAAMILQPTSPFRTAEDIDACIRKFADSGADSVMSVVEVIDFSPQKLKIIKNDVLLPLFTNEGKESARRDEGEKVYKRNAAVYLTSTRCVREHDLFGNVCRPYVMPPERSLDINTEEDFAYAEFLLSSSASS